MSDRTRFEDTYNALVDEFNATLAFDLNALSARSEALRLDTSDEGNTPEVDAERMFISLLGHTHFYMNQFHETFDRPTNRLMHIGGRHPYNVPDSIVSWQPLERTNYSTEERTNETIVQWLQRPSIRRVDQFEGYRKAFIYLKSDDGSVTTYTMGEAQ